MLGDNSVRFPLCSALMIICRCEAVLCVMTAYEAERDAHIAMTYVPAHLYYMLFELMKVSCHSEKFLP